MLELKNITKEYPAGDRPVSALRGISLKFRKSEFVSILGPSGCGKTTLLNIVGGLDQYTSGDLEINGRSTKDFNDRDWDTYRNHSIGFVFQSYNLIPHQTVLQNVEIALTVSGVSKEERRKRAIDALEQVGLGDQLSKRPNQISGGQMQRVAIARALVNDPDIILADEPTGALDTETGVQIMELLKVIAEDRLVIMVTHNPNLADSYSTRIIKMLDGKITSDSMPLEETQKYEKKEEGKKPSMSFATAFMLSLKNLFTKKGRTTLTAFAGSIGIMGIALILAVSQGMTNYIDAVQEDALSSYPLSIEETTVDISSLMETFMNVGDSDGEHDNDAVYKKPVVHDMVSAFNSIESSQNDLKSFKTFIENKYEDEEDELAQSITGLQYSYNLDFNVYTKDPEGDIVKSNTGDLLQELMSEHMNIEMTPFDAMEGGGFPMANMDGIDFGIGMGGSAMNLWQEILPGKDGVLVNEVLKNQYDLVQGSWPKAYDELVIVLDKNNELDDITLYALGLEPKEHMDSIMKAAVDGTNLERADSKWTYDEIMDQEYRVILNSDSYSYDEDSGLIIDLKKTDAGLKFLYEDALVLKVSGIVRPNDLSQSTIISGSIAYTEDLTKYIIEESKDSEIIAKQKADKRTDLLTGLPFKTNTSELSKTRKASDFRDFISELNEEKKAQTYISIMSLPSEEEVQVFLEENLAFYEREDMEAMMLEGLGDTIGVDEEVLEDYVQSMSDEEIEDFFSMSLTQQYRAQYAEGVAQEFIGLEPQQLAFMLDEAMEDYSDEELGFYYDEIMEFSENSYEENLARMGYVDIASPSVINIFASSFSNKDNIEAAIEEYNEDKEELSQIKYTDFLGIMMSSITSIINAITYVLLAFVAISLIVSSIMIGVITLISVQERTKEIGILRAIGASKNDVSSMFNAETIIIGFASGLLGVGVTYLLSIPINKIFFKVTGIANLKAYLPLEAAIVLILISTGLSLFSGFIPSRSAAKKDPVVALRTE